MPNRESAHRWEKQHIVRRTSPDGTTEVVRTKEREEHIDRVADQPRQGGVRWEKIASAASSIVKWVSGIKQWIGLWF